MKKMKKPILYAVVLLTFLTVTGVVSTGFISIHKPNAIPEKRMGLQERPGKMG